MALVVKNPSGDAGDLRDTSLIPTLERSPREGNGNPSQYLTWSHTESDTTEMNSHSTAYFFGFFSHVGY